METFDNVSIVLKTWKNLPYLQKCIESLRKYSKHNLEICICVDGPDPYTENWLKRQKDIKYVILPKHKGICTAANEAVKLSTRKYIFYLDDDNLFSPDYDKNLEPYLEDNNVVSPMQMEPGNKPVSPYLIYCDCGKDIKSFDEKKFLEKVKEHSKEESGLGVSCPYIVSRRLWDSVGGVDEIFNKSACNDTDFFYKVAIKGVKFVRVKNSILYHFQGKAQSKKEGYVADEERSIKDFQRKWGEPFCTNDLAFIRYSFGSNCIPGVDRPTKLYQTENNVSVSLVILTHNDEVKIIKLLNEYEPFFDEVVIVDDNSTDNTKKEVQNYIEKEAKTSLLFKKDKVKFYTHSVDKDFSAQRNFAISKCSSDWIMSLDSDEQMDVPLVFNLRKFILSIHSNKKVKVVGFPRINLLEGIRTQVYPDVQFRLHRKDIKWVERVHEIPEPVKRRSTNIMVVQGMHLIHPKTNEQQTKQNKLYKEIIRDMRGGDITNIIYDSVIFTTEGITKHAREEVLELSKRGYNIWLINDLPRNTDLFPKKLMDFYKPWDIHKEDYFTIINQPPPRWNRSYGLKNLIGYLAFEGNIQKDWVDIINQSQIIELWTPSEYCKKRLIDSGVKKLIYVIPHGIDPDVWKPSNQKKFDKLTFLWVGTIHNKRKGHDIMLKAFCNVFKKEDNVQLIMKVNRIYDKDQDINKDIMHYVTPECKDKIKIIDEDLTEEEMVELFNRVNYYVSPHRCEGFGINILQAMACSTSVIVSNYSGNTDFCNVNNCLLISRKDNLSWAPYIPPYSEAKWGEPIQRSLELYLEKAFSWVLTGRHIQSTLKNSDDIRKNWTWKNTVNKIEERLKNY